MHTKTHTICRLQHEFNVSNYHTGSVPFRRSNLLKGSSLLVSQIRTYQVPKKLKILRPFLKCLQQCVSALGWPGSWLDWKTRAKS